MNTIKLVEKRAVSPQMTELTFTRPQGWTFKAGQFARLGLAVGEAEPVFRAYSIAAAPCEDKLRFLITSVAEGALSPKLAALQPGDEVLLDGDAQGNLNPERIEGGETLWLLATGSGLAPFLSILHDEATWQRWKDVVVVESVRTFEDGARARDLADEQFPGDITVVIATTREEDPERMGDLSGRLTELIDTGDLEAHVGRKLEPEVARVLLCGNPNFIEATRALLKTRGFVSPRLGNPGQLLAETFW